MPGSSNTSHSSHTFVSSTRRGFEFTALDRSSLVSRALCDALRNALLSRDVPFSPSFYRGFLLRRDHQVGLDGFHAFDLARHRDRGLPCRFRYGSAKALIIVLTQLIVI